MSPDCTSIELMHRTTLDEIPLAICSYQGRVLVGVGKMLRLYDMGKKKLLRKCENKHIPNAVICINAIGQRIYVSDVQESVYAVRYKRQENQLIVFADDTHPRWITTTCVLDYDTVATADKFGNIAVVSITFIHIMIVAFRSLQVYSLACGSNSAKIKVLIVSHLQIVTLLLAEVVIKQIKTKKNF